MIGDWGLKQGCQRAEHNCELRISDCEFKSKEIRGQKDVVRGWRSGPAGLEVGGRGKIIANVGLRPGTRPKGGSPQDNREFKSKEVGWQVSVCVGLWLNYRTHERF